MSQLSEWISNQPGGRFFPENVLETDEKVYVEVSDHGFGDEAALIFRLVTSTYEAIPQSKIVELDLPVDDPDNNAVFEVPRIVAEALQWNSGEESGYWSETLT